MKRSRFAKPKMQFGLRMLLFGFVTVSAGVGWYLSMLPKTFSVEAVMPFDISEGTRIAEIKEQRGFWVANEVRRKSKRDALKAEVAYGLPISSADKEAFKLARKQLLLEDLNRIHFRSERDLELIKRFPDEFEAKAKEEFKAAKFQTRKAIPAAVLLNLGDRSYLNALLKQYVANGKRQDELYSMSFCFTPEQVSQFPEFVEALKQKIEVETIDVHRRIRFVSQLERINKEELNEIHFRLASEDNEPSLQKRSILWLLKNDDSNSNLRLAFEFLNSSKAQHWFPCDDVLQAVLASDAYRDERGRFRAEINSLACQLADDGADDFEVVAKIGGAEFMPAFNNGIRQPVSARQLQLALMAIKPLVSDDEYCQLLRELLRTSEYPAVLFDQAEKYLGLQNALSVLRDRLRDEKLHRTLALICDRTPIDQTSQMLDLLERGFEEARDDNVYEFRVESQCFQIVEYLKKFGFDERAEELKKKIPKVDSYWFEDSIAAQQFLDWFGDHFELDKPLTVKEVFAADARAEWGLQRYPGVFDIKRFKVAAFQAAGFGRVVDPENWGIDGGLFTDITSLAGDQFRIETYDKTDDIVRLLINNFVYEFAMDERWSWYANAPACDALNAMLKRRFMEERFFVFKEAYGNSYVTFVLFAEPDKVKSFVQKNPEFKVLEGCEKFWE